MQIRRDAVVQSLRRSGPMSRADVVAATGLSRSTISKVIAELMRDGVVESCQSPVVNAGRGRPTEYLRLIEANERTWVGMEFRHARFTAVIVRGTSDIVGQVAESYHPQASWAERLNVGLRLVGEELGLPSTLAGIGIGFPSAAVVHKDHLIAPGQHGELGLVRDLARTLADTYRCPVSVDNNVRLAGLAEMLWQQEGGPANQVYLRVSDGIGAAIVCDGRLVRGHSGYGGEIGHITVDASGDSCRCGKRGCLETVASAVAMIQRCQAKGLPVRTLGELAAAYLAGQRPAIEVVTEACGWLGTVLGRVSVLVDPARIILAGDVVDQFPHVVDVVREKVGSESLPVNDVVPRILPARLGQDAGPLGAVLMALADDHVHYPSAAATVDASAARPS